MLWEWLAVKGPGLAGFVIGLGFIVIGILEEQYRYFFLCIALLAIFYGYRQFRRQDTPFQRHEREMRRKQL